MVVHPTMKAAEIEALQRECFDTDFRVNGPSILRSVEVWFQGWKRYHDSDSPYLRAKAQRWAAEIKNAWPMFRVAKRSGPAPEITARLESEVREALGPPTPSARVRSGSPCGRRLDSVHLAPRFASTPQTGSACVSHHGVDAASG